MARFLLLAALLAAAGCADPGTAPARTDVLGSWVLLSGEAAGSPLPQPPGTSATLTLEERRLSGQSFCNRYFASYRLDGDGLDVDTIGQTEMACDPPVMAAESAFLQALVAVDRAAREGEELVLTGPDVTLRFTREVPAPDRELVGTRWVLDTLVQGEVASSVQGEPLLELADDGTARGSTGCRGWAGRWQRDGDALAVDASPDATACAPDLAEQDEQVLAVLTGGAVPAIDGDRLTLTADDGRGLSYRAG